MATQKISFLFILLISTLLFFACENSTPPPPKTDHDNVAKGLEKTAAFKRDTVRKDATRVEKKVMKESQNKSN